jgi:penicillin G amidase
MTQKLSAILTFSLLVLLLWIYSIPLGSLPPAGSFFHPLQGFWANAEKEQPNGEINFNHPGLNGGVTVFYDDRHVPHIFANNDYDLYYTQGYITARDRLFQMELQVRAAGGFLAEWLGDDLLEYDRNQRRLGMLYGAEQAMTEIEKDETILSAIEAYADGVNAYISTLTYEDYPLEYKILNSSPAEWKPLNTALLLKYMTQMLAARSEAVATTNTLARMGEEFVNRFLSKRPSLMDPIVPEVTEWDFDPLHVSAPDEPFLASYTEPIELWQPHPYNGSNNWVVSGTKTEGGYPILSNDMHLNMSMPSIWFEVQLHTPDQNVYGVSLQGAPTVIVGFNEQIAWGATNTGADVMDWFEITFRDENKEHYLHDGEWLPVSKRVETITSSTGSVIQDTLIFTHHGPVYETEKETSLNDIVQQNHALRWIGHDPSNELRTFYMLNRATGYEDFRDAFRTYRAPAQNVNYAGTDGNIAIQTGGALPLKWQFQGRTVSDGSNSRYDWNGFIPYEQNPYSLNPERGFLSAANQYPAGEDYPYYLGESFAPYERGRRINDRLRGMDNITADDFRELLSDTFSYHAYTLLPMLLDAIGTDEYRLQEYNLIELLADWNYKNDRNEIAPTLFRQWWRELYSLIWDNKLNKEYPMRKPARDVTVDLILTNPESVWFNNPETEQIETFYDLAWPAFEKAVERLTDRFGPNPEQWLWGSYNNTNLNHVGRIPGLGVTDLFTDGSNESVNAIWGSHGPSWRMVVELDPEGVRGYGVYPGGQSGNPGSRNYDSFIETWRSGELFELQFLREKPEPADGNRFPLIMRFNTQR